MRHNQLFVGKPLLIEELPKYLQSDGSYKFIVEIELNNLIRCGDLGALNDLADDLVSDGGFVLTNISYTVVGGEGEDCGDHCNGSVFIEINCEINEY